MDKISCNVMNCSYNSNSICYAEKVIISGDGSNKSENTCCSSFLDVDGYSRLTNNTSGNGNHTCLSCSVHTCSYNIGDKCSLNSIAVAKNAPEAKLYSETYCASFKVK